MAQKIFHFEVEGAGEFPTDMLRYDAAYPADTESAMRILTPYRWSDNAERSEFIHEKRIVKLVCHDTPPTDARWHSFGWKVTKVDRWR